MTLRALGATDVQTGVEVKLTSLGRTPAILVALVILVTAAGCGASDTSVSVAQTTRGLEAPTAQGQKPSTKVRESRQEAEANIRLTIRKLNTPRLACSWLTESFLQENYQASGAQGRRKCRQEVGPPAGVLSIHFKSFRHRHATTEVTLEGGEDIVIRLRRVSGRWLIDFINVIE
jgi:hypothetical protein